MENQQAKVLNRTTGANSMIEIQGPLIEANNIIHSARQVIDSWEADPDNYASLKQALTELRDEFKRFDDLWTCQAIRKANNFLACLNIS